MPNNQESANKKIQVVPSEQDIVQGLIKCLNENGCSYEVSSRPDKEHLNNTLQEKACDFICTDALTNKQIAIEVTTLWREENAARQDKIWGYWTDDIQTSFNMEISGYIYAITPINFPDDAIKNEKKAFSDFMHDWINSLTLDESSHDEQYSKQFKGHEILVHFHYRPGKSEISFARMAPPQEPTEIRITDFLKRNFKDIPDKLSKPKEDGLSTCVCIYNTFWPGMTPNRAKQYIIEALKTLDVSRRAIIDNVYILSGNPPNDCWIREVDVYLDCQ